MITTARCCTILLASLLSACSSVNTEQAYVPPSPPTEKAIGAAVAAIAQEAKLVTPLEISTLRPNDHGLGSFFVCVREVNPLPNVPRRYYSTSSTTTSTRVRDYPSSWINVSCRRTALHLSLRQRSLLHRMRHLPSTSATRTRRNDDWFSRI
jgi:hypothetical protein